MNDSPVPRVTHPGLTQIPESTAVHLVQQHLVEDGDKVVRPPCPVIGVDLAELVGGVFGAERQRLFPYPIRRPGAQFKRTRWKTHNGPSAIMVINISSYPGTPGGTYK